MKAYFVTTHHSLTDPSKPDSRTVGFFKTLKEAKRIVEENVCDIFEYYYKHATIDCLTDGLYPTSFDDESQETLFYAWDDDQKKYVQIERPESACHFANMSNVR